MTSEGAKRKANEPFATSAKRPYSSAERLTTDLITEQTKEILGSIHFKISGQNSIHLKNYIKDQISKMDMTNKFNKNRRKVTIGIFGRSGEGKSSLLNAILGERYFLPSGSSGACTAITTEVEANLMDSFYTADIELISKEEWNSQLRDLLKDLSDRSEETDDMTRNAKEKITALYGTNAHNKTWEELQKDAKSAEIDKLLSMNRKTISNVNSSDFAKEIAHFIQHSISKPGGWYWPLVKSVKIKIPNCHELLEHIVLVDLPGTGDCNKIRNNLWKSKLSECSSVWIISGINRAITDENPWEILKHSIYHLTQAGECKRINFICTKTDEIDPEEYIRNEWPSEEEKPVKDLKTACIRKRNICAKETVRESFENSKLKKKMSLDIFTVSSKAFFDKTLGLENSDTEIPLLQNVLRNLNKSIDRQLARDYVTEAIGILSLIKSVQLDRDDHMTVFHKKSEENLRKALVKLDCQFDMLRCVLEQCLKNGVEDSEKSCLESAHAIISPELSDGHGGFHKILKALCQNNGSHLSKAWDKELNLNMELAQHMHKNIEEEFDSVFPVCGITGKSMQEQIDKFSIICSDTTQPRSFIFSHTENFIKTEENKLKMQLKREVVKQKKEIYLSIETTIREAMAPYYQKALKFKGTGSMKRMQNTLTEGMNNLQHDMFNEAKEEVLKKFRELELYIKNTLESGIQRSIKVLLSGKMTMPDVSENTKELEDLLKQLSDCGHQGEEK